MTTQKGCSGYAGSGYIYVQDVTGGSGNYVYHIGSSINFNDPNAYNLNQSAYGLANGNYYVAVYDSVYNVISVTSGVNINCATAPAPTVTPGVTPPPTYYISLSSGGDACTAKQNFSGYQA